MKAVGVSISDVVDQVETTTQETEGQRRQRGACYGRRFKQLATEHETGEDDAVLQPLGWPHRSHDSIGAGNRGMLPERSSSLRHYDLGPRLHSSRQSSLV